MIKMALAVGFLTVFGFAAYAIVLLLTNYFQNHNKDENNNNKPKKP